MLSTVDAHHSEAGNLCTHTQNNYIPTVYAHPVCSFSCVHGTLYNTHTYTHMLNKNTLGVKKVRGQSEAALQIGMCDQKLGYQLRPRSYLSKLFLTT